MHKHVRSLIVVISCSSDPEKEDDVRRWQSEQADALRKAAIPDLLAIHGYELRPWQGPRLETFGWREEDFDCFQLGRFAVLYETRADDPSAVDAAIRGSIEPPNGIEWVHRGLYRFQVALHPEGFDPDAIRDTKGIMIAMVHPVDELRYEDWYVPVHLDDEVRHGVNHSVTRFINIDAKSRPRSLTVLETAWDDISEARAHIHENYLPNWRYPPGIKDTFEVVAASEYQGIF